MGEADPREEHRATGIVRRHIGRLSPRFSHRGRSRGLVILGCIAGERHDIGLSMVADLLRISGYDVSDLGADVPAVFLFRCGQGDGGTDWSGSGLSVHHADLFGQAEQIAASILRLPSAPLVLVGGHGVTDFESGPTAVGCVICSAEEATDFLDQHRLVKASGA